MTTGKGGSAQTVSIECTRCCAACEDNKGEDVVRGLSTQRGEMKCTERVAQTKEKAAGKMCRSRGGAGRSQTVLRKRKTQCVDDYAQQKKERQRHER